MSDWRIQKTRHMAGFFGFRGSGGALVELYANRPRPVSAGGLVTRQGFFSLADNLVNQVCQFVARWLDPRTKAGYRVPRRHPA